MGEKSVQAVYIKIMLVSGYTAALVFAHMHVFNVLVPRTVGPLPSIIKIFACIQSPKVLCPYSWQVLLAL